MTVAPLEITDHVHFPVKRESSSALDAHLERLSNALSDVEFGPPAQTEKPDLNATTVRTRLDAALTKHLGARTGIETVIPYHPEYLDVRPATHHIDALADEHAYHYALRRYQDAMYTVTTAWPIERTRATIGSGTLLAPTSAFSRRIVGSPSPFPRYAALLRQAREAGVLTLPILLVGIQPGE